jgi:hypothetical protein
MDPDLVRQQAEEEAASLRLARAAPHLETRIEPALPMAVAPIAPPGPQASAARHYQAAPESTAIAATTGWRTAIGVATSSTLGVAVGLFGGMMLGVKLQLVPLQSVLIGAASGLLLGWQLGALTLRQGGPVGWWRAYRLGLRTTVLVLGVVGTAMFVAPYLLSPPKAPNAPFAIGLFWKSMAVGAGLALLLGAMVVRRALRNPAEQR